MWFGSRNCTTLVSSHPIGALLRLGAGIEPRGYSEEKNGTPKKSIAGSFSIFGIVFRNDNSDAKVQFSRLVKSSPVLPRISTGASSPTGHDLISLVILLSMTR